eukprot:2462985-Prymnesium_polylepis.1
MASRGSARGVCTSGTEGGRLLKRPLAGARRGEDHPIFRFVFVGHVRPVPSGCLSVGGLRSTLRHSRARDQPRGREWHARRAHRFVSMPIGNRSPQEDIPRPSCRHLWGQRAEFSDLRMDCAEHMDTVYEKAKLGAQHYHKSNEQRNKRTTTYYVMLMIESRRCTSRFSLNSDDPLPAALPTEGGALDASA